ncbi:MAG TPA: LPXTG cell wall anchor domain-containing protein [Thermoleophilaceae bacterium]|nr:LPXTG cell wall anchor domain-containing protein [Thermoleophilaceae bacterium]
MASRVSLARTGFDAWALALLGGLSVAGGIGLLAAQRRGRLSA